MKRFWRWMFKGLAGASMLLSVAMAVLWGRGHWRTDRVVLSVGGDRLAIFASTNGEICVGWIVPPVNLNLEFFPNKWWDSTDSTGVDWLKAWDHHFLGFGVVNDVGNASEAMHLISLPNWFLVILFALLPGWYLRRGIRLKLADRRTRLGLCDHCGYDLRATPDRCPECGTPVAGKLKI